MDLIFLLFEALIKILFKNLFTSDITYLNKIYKILF